MYCALTRDPIDVTALTDRVRSDRDGAISVFIGVVRNHHRGRSVEGLEYEAYDEMATAVLQRICEEVLGRFEVGDAAVVHRVGELDVGEASVAIAVAGPHRDAACKASREIIERLKIEAPIWKREHYADGDAEWLEGTTPQVESGG